MVFAVIGSIFAISSFVETSASDALNKAAAEAAAHGRVLSSDVAVINGACKYIFYLLFIAPNRF